MIIPFPERISLWFAFGFAACLVIVQQMQGSDPYFSAGCLLFIVLATVAFNIAGGFSRPSGAYIFFNAMLTVIIGVTYKAYLGEPAETNLTTPRLTITVYVAGMAAMLLAAFLSSKFSSKEGLLQNTLPDDKMQGAVYGCILVGASLSVLNHFVAQGEASFLSAINQLNRFFPMAILLGVTHQVRKSGGRSSLSLPVLFAAAWGFIEGGLFGFSKEGMFTPIACWLIAAASVRYRFSLYQLGGILLGAAFMFLYLVPYAQYGRNFRDQDITFTSQVDRAVSLLTNIEETRVLGSEATQIDRRESTREYYYDHPQGFWDRLGMISIDDELIAYTEDDHVFGFTPLIFGAENVVPRVLWVNKPNILYGNVYAQELGGFIQEDDNTTGISFSPIADGWHMGRWLGILGAAPLLWFLLFLVFDSLAGSVRKAPWGLLAFVTFAHVAPEGLLSGLIYTTTYGVLSIILVAFFSAYVMPILGSLIIGPGRTAFAGGRTVHSIPRRIDPTPIA